MKKNKVIIFVILEIIILILSILIIIGGRINSKSSDTKIINRDDTVSIKPRFSEKIDEDIYVVNVSNRINKLLGRIVSIKNTKTGESVKDFTNFKVDLKKPFIDNWVIVFDQYFGGNIDYFVKFDFSDKLILKVIDPKTNDLVIKKIVSKNKLKETDLLEGSLSKYQWFKKDSIKPVLDVSDLENTNILTGKIVDSNTKYRIVKFNIGNNAKSSNVLSYVVEKNTTLKDNNIKIPTVLANTGYKFLKFDKVIDLDKKITENLIFNAVVVENSQKDLEKINISFESSNMGYINESEKTSFEMISNLKFNSNTQLNVIKQPEVVSNNGYIFQGFYTTDNIKFKNDLVVTKDTKFIAKFTKDETKWIDIEFQTDSHGSFSSNEKLRYNILKDNTLKQNLVSIPNTITNPGYILDNYYTNNNEIINLDKKYSKSTKFIAKHIKDNLQYFNHTIRLDDKNARLNNSSKILEIEVLRSLSQRKILNDHILPNIELDKGYVLVYSKDLENDNVLTSNLDLTITSKKDLDKWIDIEFQTDDKASFIQNQTLTFNVLKDNTLKESNISIPQTIVEEGYILDNYYTNNNEVINLNSKYSKSNIFIGKHIKDNTKWIDITFKTNIEGKFLDNQKLTYNILKDKTLTANSVILPDVVVNKGYLLDGFYSSNTKIDLNSKYTNSTIFTAQYTKDPNMFFDHIVTLYADKINFNNTDRIRTYSILKDESQSTLYNKLLEDISTSIGYDVYFNPEINTSNTFNGSFKIGAYAKKTENKWKKLLIQADPLLYKIPDGAKTSFDIYSDSKLNEEPNNVILPNITTSYGYVVKGYYYLNTTNKFSLDDKIKYSNLPSIIEPYREKDISKYVDIEVILSSSNVSFKNDTLTTKTYNILNNTQSSHFKNTILNDLNVVDGNILVFEPLLDNGNILNENQTITITTQKDDTKYVSLTFNALDNGIIESDTISTFSVLKSKTLAQNNVVVPQVIPNANYSFINFIDSQGLIYDETSTIDKDTTYYARYNYTPSSQTLKHTINFIGDSKFINTITIVNEATKLQVINNSNNITQPYEINVSSILTYRQLYDNFVDRLYIKNEDFLYTYTNKVNDNLLDNIITTSQDININVSAKYNFVKLYFQTNTTDNIKLDKNSKTQFDVYQNTIINDKYNKIEIPNVVIEKEGYILDGFYDSLDNKLEIGKTKISKDTTFYPRQILDSNNYSKVKIIIVKNGLFKDNTNTKTYILNNKIVHIGFSNTVRNDIKFDFGYTISNNIKNHFPTDTTLYITPEKDISLLASISFNLGDKAIFAPEVQNSFMLYKDIAYNDIKQDINILDMLKYVIPNRGYKVIGLESYNELDIVQNRVFNVLYEIDKTAKFEIEYSFIYGVKNATSMLRSYYNPKNLEPYNAVLRQLNDVVIYEFKKTNLSGYIGEKISITPPLEFRYYRLYEELNSNKLEFEITGNKYLDKFYISYYIKNNDDFGDVTFMVGQQDLQNVSLITPNTTTRVYKYSSLNSQFVDINQNYHTTYPVVSVINAGIQIREPRVVVKEGYRFDGWIPELDLNKSFSDYQKEGLTYYNNLYFVPKIVKDSSLKLSYKLLSIDINDGSIINEKVINNINEDSLVIIPREKIDGYRLVENTYENAEYEHSFIIKDNKYVARVLYEKVNPNTEIRNVLIKTVDQFSNEVFPDYLFEAVVGKTYNIKTFDKYGYTKDSQNIQSYTAVDKPLHEIILKYTKNEPENVERKYIYDSSLFTLPDMYENTHSVHRTSLNMHPTPVSIDRFKYAFDKWEEVQTSDNIHTFRLVYKNVLSVELEFIAYDALTGNRLFKNVTQHIKLIKKIYSQNEIYHEIDMQKLQPAGFVYPSDGLLNTFKTKFSAKRFKLNTTKSYDLTQDGLVENIGMSYVPKELTNLAYSGFVDNENNNKYRFYGENVFILEKGYTLYDFNQFSRFKNPVVIPNNGYTIKDNFKTLIPDNVILQAYMPFYIDIPIENSQNSHTVTFIYVDSNNNEIVLPDLRYKVVTGQLGQTIQIPHPTSIAGYTYDNTQIDTYTFTNTEFNYVLVKYIKDITKFATIKFEASENSYFNNAKERTQYEVLKGVELSSYLQPEKIFEPSVLTLPGYNKLTPLWNNNYSLDLVVENDMVFKTLIEKVELETYDLILDLGKYAKFDDNTSQKLIKIPVGNKINDPLNPEVFTKLPNITPINQYYKFVNFIGFNFDYKMYGNIKFDAAYEYDRDLVKMIRFEIVPFVNEAQMLPVTDPVKVDFIYPVIKGLRLGDPNQFKIVIPNKDMMTISEYDAQRYNIDINNIKWSVDLNDDTIVNEDMVITVLKKETKKTLTLTIDKGDHGIILGSNILNIEGSFTSYYTILNELRNNTFIDSKFVLADSGYKLIGAKIYDASGNELSQYSNYDPTATIKLIYMPK